MVDGIRSVARLALAARLAGVLALAAGFAGPARADAWSFGWHGYAYLDSNRQGGPSGGRDFESINHFMAFASRPAGGWTMSLLGTFSLEPATIRPEGSPLLFQRGETYNDVLIVDRQHAHDLFVQLGAEWTRPLTKSSIVRLFAGLRGEPAVGPAAYPHRPSASEIPIAPLSHHNQDSTHISDDVLTAGYTVSIVTIEGSAFHGKEPDENRWDLDQGSIDSYAGRLTLRPVHGLEFQVSACHREEPEALEEGDQTRVTASASWERSWDGGSIAALASSGKNELPGGLTEWGHLLEATWNLRHRHFIYGRLERVDRDVYELTFKTQRPDTVAPDPTHVETLDLGYSIDVPLLKEAESAVGAAVAFYRFDSSLDDVYGSDPISFWAYLRFRFGSAGAHAHHH